MTAAACSCGRPAASGSWLCSRCGEFFRRDLETVADLWPHLQDRLAHNASDPHAERVDTTPSPGISLNEKAGALMRQVIGWTWDQVRTVLDERTDKPVTLPKDQDTPRLLTWLAANHAGWLTAHDQDLAQNLADEAADLARQARDLADGDQRRFITFGPCFEHSTTDLGERQPCDGEIRAIVNPASDRLPAVISCTGTVEHHVWPPSRWHALARQLQLHTTDQDAAAAFLRLIDTPGSPRVA